MNCKNFLGRIIPYLLSFFLLFASISMSFAQEEPSITFTTSKKVGETIKLAIYSKEGEPITIEGVNEAYSQGSKSYTLKSSEVKIIGNITGLDCSNNNITSLDLGKSTHLTFLYCYDNQLTTLDLSKNPNLIYLYCHSNQLTNLDLSKNAELQILWCLSNQLTDLDLSNNPNLKELDCRSNRRLRALDLSKNPNLEKLDCSSNKLTSLDLSENKKLEHLQCSYNQITSIILQENSNINNVLLCSNKLTKDAIQNVIDKLAPINLSANEQDSKGYFVAVNKLYPSENNFISKEQVKVLRAKGWKVRDFNGGVDENNSSSDFGIAFEGDDDVSQEPSITFTTSKAIGETITLDITPKWGVITIEGVNEAYSQGNRSYTLNSQNIKIYGQIASLGCSKNNITSLDISKSTDLEQLFCYDNQLTTLDLSKNPNLEVLSCNNNQLTVLDLSKNTKLKQFYCNENKLLQLNLENSPNLQRLDCFNNQLTDLNISKNAKLEGLYCYNNQLTVLDLSENAELQTLWCLSNQLTDLDLSKNAKLQELDCRSNKLTSLDLSENVKLKHLLCAYNQLTSIVLPESSNIENVLLFGNKLSKEAMQSIIDKLAPITLSANEQDSKGYFVAVNKLYPSENNFISKEQVKSLTAKAWKVRDYNDGKDESNSSSDFGIAFVGYDDVAPQEPSITFTTSKAIGETIRLSITPKDGETITIEGVKEAYSPDKVRYTLQSQNIKIYGQITSLICPNNNITGLDISKNQSLLGLNCDNNQLTVLDLSENTELQSLECQNNQLTSLDISKNTNLLSLACYNNQLIALDFSKNTNLQRLYCQNNQLTSLDISKNTNLQGLGCSNNQLTSLDISKNPKLEILACYNNQLTSLDLSENTNLIVLDCGNNKLTSLELSKNTELQKLYCNDNQIANIVLPNSSKLNNIALFTNKLNKKTMQYIIDKLANITLSTDDNNAQKGYFVVVNKKNSEEANFISKGQVKALTAKGWKVRDYNDGKDENNSRFVYGIAFDGYDDNDTTSISEVSTSSVSIYPNPATSYLIVKGLAYNSIAKLYNMAGELVLETIVSDDTRIDLSKLPSARYILVVDGKAHQILINK